MKSMSILGWTSALLLSVAPLQAQETNEVEMLKKQLQQQQQQIDALIKQVSALTQVQSNAAPPPSNALTATTAPSNFASAQTNTAATNAPSGASGPSFAEQLKELRDKVDSALGAQTQDRPNEFNPSIGLVGDTVFSYRSEGSEATGSEHAGGFDAYQRAVELAASASVDPYAKAYVVANASADAATGESTLGIEEAAIQTTSLPWNLEVKAGRFFGEFGKLSYIHDHELPSVNRPLALDQYIGGESRTDGIQLNWLLPVPHYTSLTLGAGNGFGGDSPLNNPGTFRHLSGFNYFGRLSTYFDVTPNIQLETGISGLVNPTTQDRGGDIVQADGVSTYTEKKRQVGGLDFKLSYVPLQNNQFKRLDWGTELLFSDSQYQVSPTGIPVNPGSYLHTVGSLGGYTYLTYKWHRQWSGGFQFDYVQNAMDHNDETFAYSPYLTWAISHWNQLRLQYTHTEPAGSSTLRPDDAIYLQWSWIIGSHSHGWQQR